MSLRGPGLHVNSSRIKDTSGEWLSIGFNSAGKHGIETKKSSTICSRHFEPDMFTIKSGPRQLSWNAKTCLFLTPSVNMDSDNVDNGSKLEFVINWI